VFKRNRKLENFGVSSSQLQEEVVDSKRGGNESKPSFKKEDNNP